VEILPDENITKTRRFMEEVFDKGNLKGADEFMSASFIDHDPFPGQGQGIEGFKQVILGLRQAFPDLHLVVEDIFESGDKVVVRSTMKGTHKGALMSMPPTGKQISVKGIDIVRISVGKAVEHWGLADVFTMMQQLGAIPASR